MEWLTPALIVGACLVLSAFFSGSETALLRLGAHDVEEEVESLRGPAAIAVRDLLGHTSRLLVTILLGNNLVNILGAAAASALAIHYLGRTSGIVVSTAVMTVIVLIFCEVLPKAVARGIRAESPTSWGSRSTCSTRRSVRSTSCSTG